jgi:hypothetical protein
MDSTKLRPWQAKAVLCALRPTLGYLYRLLGRMESRGFPPDDNLLKLTANAYDALHALTVSLHYLSCEDGAGRKRRR